MAAALTLAAACSNGSGDTAVTVTENVTLAPSTTIAVDPPAQESGSEAPPVSPGSVAGSSTAAGGSSSSAAGSSSSTAGSSGAQPAGDVVMTEPDGFQVTKLAAGAKPPQFVVVSFDGVGWDEKWDYWLDISTKVNFHFTGFLSGIYLLSDQNKTLYTGPGHGAGKSSINFNTVADLPTEIGHINQALTSGDEIGTHFNGHFCDDNPPGGTEWNTANWDDELDQFFGFVANVNTNNNISDKLNLTADEIKGERTPCLTGHKADLYPALQSHNMTYDSSFTRVGQNWPEKENADGDPDPNGVWGFGMAEYPLAGTGHPQITMDYNFWVQQENGADASPDKSAADSAQVLATYTNMYHNAMAGNRAPLVLGNHFEDWNNNAYSNAIANFVLANCNNPDTYCVPFRDVVDWMNAQDPTVLGALQNQQADLGGCPYTAWPKCDGLTGQ